MIEASGVQHILISDGLAGGVSAYFTEPGGVQLEPVREARL